MAGTLAAYVCAPWLARTAEPLIGRAPRIHWYSLFDRRRRGAAGLLVAGRCRMRPPDRGGRVRHTKGGAAFRNVHGSFYDFIAERYRGTSTEPLCAPPDAWGGRAAVAWVEQLAESAAFDPAIESALDRLYGRDVAVSRLPVPPHPGPLAATP